MGSIELNLKLKGTTVTEKEKPGDEWTKQKKAQYVGSYEGVAIKLDASSPSEETLKRVFNPVKGQQFILTLRQVSEYKIETDLLNKVKNMEKKPAKEKKVKKSKEIVNNDFHITDKINESTAEEDKTNNDQMGMNETEYDVNDDQLEGLKGDE